MKEVDIDYEYEIQQKVKQAILDYKFPPLKEKPRFFILDIYEASKTGNLASVQWLIEKENVDKNTILKEIEMCGNAILTKNDVMPIHVAVKYNHLSIVEYLIEKQNVDIEIKDNEGCTPIYWAAKWGRLRIVEYLISKGANIETENENCWHLIHLASSSGLLSIVQYLIEKRNVDKDIKAKVGETPLHFACCENRLEIVKYLISKGANIEAKKQYGETPLYWACFNGHLPIAEYLLSKGANIDTGDLASACLFGHLSIVKYLISKGAKIEIKDEDVLNTPLHYVSMNHQTDVVKYLLSKGANKYAKNKDGKTPYDYASLDEIRSLLKRHFLK